MKKIMKYYFSPGFFGILSCIFLIVSRLISSAGNISVAISNIISITVLCLCIHLVRRTAAYFEKHIWQNKCLLVLFLIPVFALSLTIIQFILQNDALVTNAFTENLIKTFAAIFSFPIFFSFYFLFVGKRIGNKPMLIGRWFFLAVSILYLITRILCSVVFPALLIKGITVPSLLIKLSESNSLISMIMYGMAFFAFIYITLTQNGEKNHDR